MTLIEFTASYRYSFQCGKNSLQLRDKSGYIFKRQTDRVVRFKNHYDENDPDNFFREHVMLYIPWRKEKRDILSKDFEQPYVQYKENILKMKKKYITFDEFALGRAFADVAERAEDSKQNLNQKQLFDFDTYTLNDNFGYAEAVEDLKDNSAKTVSFTASPKVKEKDLREIFAILNQDQRDCITEVVNQRCGQTIWWNICYSSW